MLKINEGLSKKHSDTFISSAITAVEATPRQLAFDNSIQASIITTATSGNIVVTNNAACKLLGYSRKELLAKSRSDIFDVHETSFQKMLMERMTEGQSSALVIARKKNRQQIPCEITSAVFTEEDGTELAVTTIVDISQTILHQQTANTKLRVLNKKLETSKKDLQNTNEQLNIANRKLFELNESYNIARLYSEAIVTTIHEPLLILNGDYRIKSANESFYKAFQLKPGETIGNVLFELENNGWDIPELRSHLIEIQTDNEKFLEWEVTYLFPLAGKRTICFKAKPFQRENGKRRILLALDDITIRKEKENADKKNADDLVKILENIPQITFTALPDGSITYFNKFFLDYSGMTFDEALKKGWEPLIKPDMLEEFKKLWGNVLNTGEDFKMELQLKNKNENAYRWHLYRAAPIRNDEGTIISWVAAATDLHDRITREQEKDEFLSIASHELKTPLTTAKAYVQLLQLGMEETNNKDLIYAQKASGSIDRLGNLIGELLDVSKIQNGKLNLNITTFNFNEMMLAAIEDVQCASPTHAIIKKGEIEKAIRGDKERLQQVVVNLLSNAIKYSPKANKVVVTISLQKNGEIKVSVKDRGIGIKRENLWKIFERYYREEGRAIHFQGLGIGLYISYEIIQRHNGKLWAEINGGRGSTFYFTVPAEAM